ncbi:S41 family peptidase, partial [uncultured Dialister sp.]
MSKFHMSWKNVLLHIVLCLALCIVFLTGVLYWLTDDPQAFIGFLCNYRTVKADYYEPVSDRVLFEGAVNGMVKSLGDPYSTYLTGEKLNSFIQGINGEYHGIGIIIGFTIDKEPVILYVIPNSPAASAGLKSGDVLKSVDGKSIDGWEPNAISQSIQGESGTSVKIGYTRGSES